jgi:hypothetical protein
MIEHREKEKSDPEQQRGLCNKDEVGGVGSGGFKSECGKLV